VVIEREQKDHLELTELMPLLGKRCFQAAAFSAAGA
jgi:hypothetical protein